jgi:hypothetical protein
MVEDVSEVLSSPRPEQDEVAEASFFDLQPPASTASHLKVEDIMKRLFSKGHLQFILGDHLLFSRFSSFLNQYKPQMIPTLIRYLEMRKSLKAIEYANAVARSVRSRVLQLAECSLGVWDL